MKSCNKNKTLLQIAEEGICSIYVELVANLSEYGEIQGIKPGIYFIHKVSIKSNLVRVQLINPAENQVHHVGLNKEDAKNLMFCILPNMNSGNLCKEVSLEYPKECYLKKDENKSLCMYSVVVTNTKTGDVEVIHSYNDISNAKREAVEIIRTASQHASEYIDNREFEKHIDYAKKDHNFNEIYFWYKDMITTEWKDCAKYSVDLRISHTMLY